MKVQSTGDFSPYTSSQPMVTGAQLLVAHGLHLGYNGRHRSGSLDNERLWRPASGFVSKHKADLEAKRLQQERQMQQMQEEQTRREAELAKGPKPNEHVIVEEGAWKTVVTHGRRDRQEDHAATIISISQPAIAPAVEVKPHDLLSVLAVVNTGCSLSQDERETVEVARRKKRHRMKRRQKTPSQRVENKLDTMDRVPHPSLLGEVMFTRRSSLQKLADKQHENPVATQRARGRHNSTGAMPSPNPSIRKTKSSSSMIVHHGGSKKHSHNASADSSPRGHTHQGYYTKRRSNSRHESPRSPCSGMDFYGSPRPRKCGDKRDFFFRNLSFELRSQLQVDEVAAFSVTDYEMATKISQFVLKLFAPSKDDTTFDSRIEDREDGSMRIEGDQKYPLAVTDGTACVGGNVLSFCDYFTHVNAVENDATRVQMLRHNLQVLQKKNVTCMHANYLDVMLQLKQDVVFLDPPWGGPEYKDLEKVDLFLGGLPLHEICTRLKVSAKCIVLKVPSNFDDAKFAQRVPGKVVIRRDFKKMHLVLLDFRNHTLHQRKPSIRMSFGGFGNSNAPPSGGFGGFGASGTSGGFGSSAAASPFGGGATTGGFGSGTLSFGAGAAKPAFGGFGAATSGTGSGFGAQQTPTTGFGGFGASVAPSTSFGAATNPATTSGFGASSAFGGNAATSGFGATGTSTFGSSTPFGAKSTGSPSPFGATSAFGGGAGTTNAFGGNATTGGFGTPTPNSGGMFGGTTTGFGAPAAKSPFGATSTATTGGFGTQTTGTTGFGGFGSQPVAGAISGAVQVGTGQPPYQPTREMEPSGTGGTANYVSISRMPAYSHKSTEELRYEDYLKRTDPAAAQAAATQNAPAPGMPTAGSGAFGGFGVQPATTSAFGSTPSFGSQTSAFGTAPSNSSGGFGSSAFGSTATPTATGGFGGFGSQPAATATNSGLFGATAARPATGTFGAPATSNAFGAAPGATSAFGAPAAGSGFGTSTGGFGATFGATAPAQTGGFGGFGTTTAASSGFGASAFGKPAVSTGFGGFGAPATPATTPATGGFGFGATQPQAGTSSSFFGGSSAAPPASSGFSFGATAPKPASTGGFGFGSTTGGTGAFGSTTGGAFGATAAPGGFGATPAQPTTGTSLFGSTIGANGSSGGFGFGNTPSATLGGTTSLFGATKPASSGTFGSSTGSASTGGLFGNTAGTGSSSFFGGMNTNGNTGATGFGFGTGGSFGSTGTGSFGGFGNTATPAVQAGGFGSTGSLFGQPQQPAQPFAAQPQNLVAAPDINPYGAGSFGDGLVEQNVKAALDLQSIKSGSSASRLASFADDVGLPRGPMDPPLVIRRQTLSNRHAIPVAFIRGPFKGSKSRFSTFTTPALSSTFSSGSHSGLDFNGDSGSKEDIFKFTSSLFRNPTTKKLVIDKVERNPIRDSETSSRVSIVPITDGDRSDVREIGNGRARLLKPEDDGMYSVSFCNRVNKKTFSLRLYPSQTIKQARTEVKQLLRESSTSAVVSIFDVELVLKGRIMHDASTIEEVQLKEGDTIDIIVIEGRVVGDKISNDQRGSISSSANKTDIPPSEETVPTKRFMTYDEYLAAASRDEDDVFKETEAQVAFPVSRSCPILRNNDYYTKPAYERLQAMTDDELSQVEQFTIGCRGLGAVEWIGKTDVRDLDLDSLVVFERKEVVVYKDEEKKHPLGKGLNKPAIVELLGIFPPRKSISPENYKERVKQRTKDIGATFLDYSVENGIWRFRVEHFSRYGFNDDDDDVDVDMDDHDAKSKKLQHIDLLPRKLEMTRGPLKSRRKIPFTAERSDLFRQSSIFAGQVGSNSVVASFGDSQNSFTSSDKLEIQSNDMKCDFATAESQIDCSDEEASTTKKDEYPTSDAFCVVPYILKPLGLNRADHLKCEDKSTTYQMMVQLSNEKQATVARNSIDGGIFMARSFRCSWGPNGELVNLGMLITHSENYLKLANMGRRVCIEFPLRLLKTRKSDLHDGVKLHYEFTSQGRSSDDFIDRDGSEVPAQYVLPVHDPLMSCLHKYVAHAEYRTSKTPSEKRTLLLWKLIQALWGQEHGAVRTDGPNPAFYPLASQNDPAEIETMDTFQTIEIRREAISRWFEAALHDNEGSALCGRTPSPENVLNLLCQHKISEASEMAVDCDNLYLATLIAQTATYEGDDFRRLMETQMAQWSENGFLEFMDKSLVLIYSMMAGSVEVLTAHKGASVSWIACLALFLWYKRGPATSLKSAMTLYKDAVHNQQASDSLSQFAFAGTDKDDVLMELMKLYIGDAASLCKVLSPSGFMSQNLCHLDYELTWHLHSVLRAIGYKLDREWESHIHQNFIRQLESAGLWKDAIYVALNISDVIERESTCRELLFRNADVLDSDVSKREQLCEHLGLPTEWVSEALAVRAIAKQEHHEEIAHWIAARRYEEAHACVIAHVAMRYLFANEKDVLMQLLAELEPMAMYIPQWKNCEKVDMIGGGLVLEYLRLELQEGLEAGHEEQYLQRVMLLLQQLSSAQDASVTKVGIKREKRVLLAQTCVSSMIVSLATQAVELRSLLSYTQGRDMTSDAPPLELDPEFLNGLSHLVTGRQTSFVESYRSSQLTHLCSTFIDWRV